MCFYFLPTILRMRFVAPAISLSIDISPCQKIGTIDRIAFQTMQNRNLTLDKSLPRSFPSCLVSGQPLSVRTIRGFFLQRAIEEDTLPSLRRNQLRFDEGSYGVAQE